MATPRFGRMNEIGQTGLRSWNGYIEEDFLRELHGAGAYRRYNEMRLNSPVAGALLMAIELSMRGVSMQFTSDEENDPRVELLDYALNSMSHSWNDHLIASLTFLTFGFALFEICYKREGSKILWKKFSFRGQDTVDTWELESDGGIKGFSQVTETNPDPVFIPIEKLILYRTNTEKNNPEGRSIFRTAWYSYYFCKNMQQIEGIGVERDLAGMPVVKLPSGVAAGSTDETKAKQVVRNIRRDEQEGITLPHDWELELLSTGGARQFDTNAIIRRYESRILMSALAQFLMLGQDKVGTQALSKDQTDFFAMAVNAQLDTIFETFFEYPVKRLLKLNGYDAEGLKIEHSPAGDVDIMAIADFLQKIGNRITYTPEDEQWLRGLVDMPELDPDYIAEQREAQAERSLAFAQSFRKDDDKELSARIMKYASEGAAPDDEERARWELRHSRLNKRFFVDQKSRVEKEARKAKRGQ